MIEVLPVTCPCGEPVTHEVKTKAYQGEGRSRWNWHSYGLFCRACAQVQAASLRGQGF